MDKLLELKSYLLFVILVFPGLISMHVYRFLLPARLIDWRNALLEAAFYSAVNFGLCCPVLSLLLFGDLLNESPGLALLAFFVIIFVAPIVWPIIYVWGIRAKLLARFQIPFPTAWDAFFDRREACFVLVSMKDGTKVGGLFGEDSYATAFPNEGSLYLSAVYEVDENGKFGAPIPHTKGCLVRKDDYCLIEFFEIPEQEEHGK